MSDLLTAVCMHDHFLGRFVPVEGMVIASVNQKRSEYKAMLYFIMTSCKQSNERFGSAALQCLPQHLVNLMPARHTFPVTATAALVSLIYDLLQPHVAVSAVEACSLPPM